MEAFNLMLNNFFGHFDTMDTMSSLAIIFMIIANALSFLRHRNETAQTFYVGIALVAAAFSVLGILLSPLEFVSVFSIYPAFILVCCSICFAFWTAFTKQRKYYVLASVLFYVAVVLAYLLMKM